MGNRKRAGNCKTLGESCPLLCCQQWQRSLPVYDPVEILAKMKGIAAFSRENSQRIERPTVELTSRMNLPPSHVTCLFDTQTGTHSH